MATLNFKGKSAVWNHHLSVPYQTLDLVEKMSLKGTDADENLIIEGDNLVALKSLLPKYQGKIKCIYIDPPYNTGNEGWVYDDNVNNPIIKSWIGETVGKEGEDLTRHDKWLCMMTPRLKLLRELLSDDGIIFMSIDDNEVSSLKCLMDEIFSPQNFLANLVWANKEGGGSSDSKNFRIKHEYIIVYAKDIELADISGVAITNEDRYVQTDKHKETRGSYYLQKLGMGTIQYSESLDYPITTPDGNSVMPSENNRGKKACWRWSKKKLNWGLENDFIEFKQDKDSVWQVYTKQYLNCDNEGNLIERSQRPFGVIDQYSSTQATKALTELFGVSVFSYPKPVELILHLISLVVKNEDIVLDSFAGSGTTAEAVLRLNQNNKINTKFILIQLPETLTAKAQARSAGYDHVHEITRDRVKKVIERDELAVGFTYYKLGKRIDTESILSGDLPTYEEFAKYVYYLATGKNFPEKSKVNKEEYFVGNTGNDGVFLIYEQDFEKLKGMALTLDIAKKMNEEYTGRKIIYAPACFLDEEHLEQYNITFVGIPFNLFERI